MLLADLPDPHEPGRASSGSPVAAVMPELMHAWVRMLRLMRQPADIAALAPVYEREILCRVLQGPHGGMLRAIAMPHSNLSRIGKAIQRIRRDFDMPPRVEALAECAAMSVSAFHRHFRSVTALSPCSSKSVSVCCRRAG